LRVHVHPGYFANRDPLVMQNDIAIIRTISRIRFGEFIQPAPLSFDRVSENNVINAIGWGITGNVNSSKTALT
jgi:hypothetical protein